MDNNEGRYAVFIEARNGAKRTQWMLFPPARQEWLESAGQENAGRFIKRQLDRPGHRAKWQTTTKPAFGLAAHTLKLQLDQYESTAWTILAPVVIELELDDYQKAWDGKDATTPYKALRHVEKWTQLRGYRLA